MIMDLSKKNVHKMGDSCLLKTMTGTLAHITESNFFSTENLSKETTGKMTFYSTEPVYWTQKKFK